MTQYEINQRKRTAAIRRRLLTAVVAVAALGGAYWGGWKTEEYRIRNAFYETMQSMADEMPNNKIPPLMMRQAIERAKRTAQMVKDQQAAKGKDGM